MSLPTILVSEPDARNQVPYLPYMWAVLKSHCDRHGLRSEVVWSEPIRKTGEAASLLAAGGSQKIDVLGLSSYVWNWDLQCQLADMVKSRWPDCLVVAGGPHPEKNDPDFFKKHPYVDMIAVQDGEITFERVLKRLLDGGKDYTDISGLVLPNPDGGTPINTGRAEVPTEFSYSPYLDQVEYYEQLAKSYRPGHFTAILETNRGCPFSCSFCDWGSNTMSRVRRFELDRVKAEIEWFGRVGVQTIWLVDANFGILPRDVEIADFMNLTNNTSGFPKFLYYCSSKNNPERSITIAKKFTESKLVSIHTFAIQHTRKEVLAGTDRANISVAKQRQVAGEMLRSGIPTDTQLILGIPGDTYETWKGCLSDLMEWGIHEDYTVYNYCLLPNAPAASDEYRTRWELKTVTRNFSLEYSGVRKKGDAEALIKHEIIVECKTFTRSDWVRMRVYSAFVKAMHNAGMTRLIAMYLYFSHGVPYREFYESLIETFFPSKVAPIYDAVLNYFREFLICDDAVEDMEVMELPDFPYRLEAARWVYLQVCLEFDEFFGNLQEYLLAKYPEATNLMSAIQFQRCLLMLPEYDRNVGFSFATNHDWIAYAERAGLLTEHEQLEEPRSVPGARVIVRDQFTGRRSLKIKPLDWNMEHGSARWIAWADRTLTRLLSTSSTTFQELELRV
jgi:2-(S-pantetheinyl)-carbapenam-3-carboxylate methyltransferase